jgi:hypothetical protein
MVCEQGLKARLEIGFGVPFAHIFSRLQRLSALKSVLEVPLRSTAFVRHNSDLLPFTYNLTCPLFPESPNSPRRRPNLLQNIYSALTQGIGNHARLGG